MSVSKAKTNEPHSPSPEFETLIQTVLEYNPQADVEIIRKAYNFSESLHRGQKRSSGEPYIQHPLEVARILATYQLDTVTIATGLLHDTVEDTATTIEQIEANFGSEIRTLVDGLTKIAKISFRTSEEKQAENFRKMVLAMAKDIRVILIKLADRLHNMRTLQHLKPEKQMMIAQETLDIYSPLANRLGLSAVKQELEDLGLRFTKPEVYYRLVQLVSKKLEDRANYTQDVQQMIQQALTDHGYTTAAVTGRPKHFFSIHKKMESRNLTFDQIHDMQGFRILVASVEQCYATLGIIHSIWTPIPGRFKDYIAIPKANMYQSLHTTVIGPGGERIEIQIRTHKMHETAEKGIAAHWAYKEGKPTQSTSDHFTWLNRLVEWNNEFKDPTDFLESVKLDLFAEDVYVFTPKGLVKEFPQGSTPLDFAYAVHTDLGHRCIGAKVDGRLVPLKHKLVSGDTIEILTSPNQKPNKDWLKIVKTSRAKNKIRAFIKTEEYEQSKAMGQVMLEREVKRSDYKGKNPVKDGTLQKIAESFSLKSMDDLFSEIGYGKLSVHKVISKLVNKPSAQAENRGPLQQIFDKAAEKSHDRQVVKVKGVDDLLIRFARCCNPVPGEAVIGFITRGRGISVHQNNCPKVLNSDSHRRIEIEWDQTKQGTREVKVRIISEDRPGLLADLSRVIRDNLVNITRAQIGTTKDKKAVCVFGVNVTDLGQLRKIISTLEGVPGVVSVTRVQKKE
jgi:GTP diphosphokinase / guanosine-3',5'-bis(diphosphate) 3'-diphosphatase